MDKKFYLICRTAKTTGIGALMLGFLSHILYAISKDYIPIIDLQHYQNQYFKEGRTFKENPWEYFLEQPLGYTLDNISEESEVIISDNSLHKDGDFNIHPKDIPVTPEETDNGDIYYFKDKFKKYIRFNDSTIEYLDYTYKNIINNNENTLGVLVRGTDYLVKKPKKEFIQPKPKTIIKKVKSFLKKHPDITNIYIATEDAIVYQLFKKEFGERLIDNNQYRYTYKDKEMPFLADIKIERPNHNYQLAREYLSNLYILSKCKYFIGGRCGGSIVAWLLAENWKDFYIWNLGKYGEHPILTKIFQLANKFDKNNQKYKEITILGIKFKYKRKNPRNQ